MKSEIPTKKKDWGYPVDYNGKFPRVAQNWSELLKNIGNLVCFSVVTKGGVPKVGCKISKLCKSESCKVGDDIVNFSQEDFKKTWKSVVAPNLDGSGSLADDIGKVAKRFCQKRAYGTFHDASTYNHCCTEITEKGGGSPLYKPVDDAMITIGWDAANFMEVKMFFGHK